MAALRLRCCMQGFFSGEQGLLFVAVRGATLCWGARASHRGGFSCCGALALGPQASVVVARRLQ